MLNFSAPRVDKESVADAPWPKGKANTWRFFFRKLGVVRVGCCRSIVGVAFWWWYDLSIWGLVFSEKKNRRFWVSGEPLATCHRTFSRVLWFHYPSLIDCSSHLDDLELLRVINERCLVVGRGKMVCKNIDGFMWESNHPALRHVEAGVRLRLG